MNEHKAPGNEQATSPAASPMKNNALGMNAPVKNARQEITKPMKPSQPDVLATHQKSQAEFYRPGAYPTDYPQRGMQQADSYTPSVMQTGMYPSSAPQMGMYPSSMPQTGISPTGMPQRSIFQPAMQQETGMMQPSVVPPRTSVMTSGIGVRDSVLTGTNFTQGFLQTQVGRYIKAEFVIGTNMLVDREGTLIKVGTDYILIQEPETDDYLLCDIYSIKFIRFYY